ncbi:unnamed protein product [Pedinophyceae sp. YPF-701]|nr:unnamed protein product [Pedinophyceae sp. YPF-701]
MPLAHHTLRWSGQSVRESCARQRCTAAARGCMRPGGRPRAQNVPRRVERAISARASKSWISSRGEDAMHADDVTPASQGELVPEGPEELVASEPGLDFNGDPIAQDDLALIGGIMGAHGVSGELKVKPITDAPELRFGQPGPRFLGPDSRRYQSKLVPPREVNLLGGRKVLAKGAEAWIVRLEGVETREAAQALSGQSLYVHVADREDIEEEGLFYVQELVGMEVYLQNAEDPDVVGAKVGTVVEVCDGTGTHDVLRIRRVESDEAGEERTTLIPFAKEIVPYVDLEDNVMVITPPEGLLDLVTKGPWQGGRRRDGRSRARKGGRSKKRDKAAAARESRQGGRAAN